MSSRKPVIALLLILVLSASLTFARKRKSEAPSQMSEQQRALHALNRLTFGPRPGDVDRVMAMGLDKWIELQLHPDKIDDAALAARLEPLRTLRMDTQALLEKFPPPAVVKTVAEGKLAMPSDPERRAIYQAQVERYRERRGVPGAPGSGALGPEERKQENAAAPQDPNAQNTQNADFAQMTDAQKQERREQRRQALERAERLLAMPPDERFRELLRMDDFDRRSLVALPREQLGVPGAPGFGALGWMFAGFTPEQRETALALVSPQLVVTNELRQGKLLRAIYSERQLEEVMTDFWFNHFNVFIGKGADRYLLTGYERDVIRAHALGKFKDLLVATAKSPAMLFYLDNWMSVGPDSEFAKYGPQGPRAQNRRRYGPYAGMGPWWRVGGRVPMGPPLPPRAPQNAQNKGKRQTGLNENYARELMELHTLGVNGGYSQKDVTEVAKVFTGWTLKEPRKGGEFEFNERRHQPGEKFVLGRKIKEHGEDEGIEVLEMLARHPSTARFISTKLAQRFVADDPPPALVTRMADKFRESDGDIREVLRVMFSSPEFWSPQTYRAKVKTPLEFVASAVRASGAEVQDATPLLQALNHMGMPLYGAQPPTGYSMQAETWVNSSALLNRMNFALWLASGRMSGLVLSTDQMLSAYKVGKHHQVEAESMALDSPEAVLAQLEGALLAGDISRQTHETIQKRLNDSEVSGRVLDDPQRAPNVGVITGLILGSPEFQRR